MDRIFEHFKETGYLHHAHIIEGDAEELLPLLLAALERNMGIVAEGNPDVSILNYPLFGVEESRLLNEMQSHSAFGKDALSRKIFMVGTKSLTREAQNALLKTFEEPTAGTHFFVVVPNVDTILPTLLSRMIFVDGTKSGKKSDDTKKIAEDFLRSSLKDRFAMAKKLTETKKGEPADRDKIRRILDQMERILYERTKGKPSNHFFRELYQVKTYLSDRGSSPKILLDHLVLALPILS